MISTDIVIVSYKDEEDLKRCIASVEEHCHDYNLIIEDNNVDNRGFSKGTNDGIKKGSAPFCWLLNSDAVVLPGAQEGLLYRFSQGKQIGIVGSMQLDYDNRDLIRHAGTIRAFPAGQHKGGYLSMGHGQVPEKNTWVNFASVMIRREMMDKIGMLDESMFLLYSDSDFCYMARKNGYEVWYEPTSRVLHKLNVSKGVTEWHKKDMERFMNKWGIFPREGGFAFSEEFRNLDMFP